MSARRPQGNGYDGSGGATPRGDSGSAGISGDGGTGEAGRSPLRCGRGIMNGMHGTLRNAPGRGEGTGAVGRPGGGEAGKGPGRGAVTSAAPDTQAGGAGNREGRAPGRTRRALRLAAAGDPQSSGGMAFAQLRGGGGEATGEAPAATADGDPQRSAARRDYDGGWGWGGEAQRLAACNIQGHGTG